MFSGDIMLKRLAFEIIKEYDQGRAWKSYKLNIKLHSVIYQFQDIKEF